MNHQVLLDEIEKLPREVQVCLAAEVLDRADRAVQGSVLTPEQRKEVVRRLAEYEKNPSTACTWEEFEARTRNSA